MKKLLFLAMIGTLISCQPNEINPDCIWEITSNGENWDLRTCTNNAEIFETTWRLTFSGWTSREKREIISYEYLRFDNLKLETGTFDLASFEKKDNTTEIKALRYDVQEDIFLNDHLLDTDADNFITIDSYDPETGLLTGAFHTEWLKQDASMPGPDRQVLHCEYFEVILEEGVK